MKDKLGLVSISFRKNTPEEILKAMKAAGLSFVEWGSDVHAKKDDPAALAALAGLQREYGVTCCSYGTYFYLGSDPVEELDGYITAAETLGTHFLRLWCGRKNSGEYTPGEKAAFFETCRAAAAVAERRGAVLCMECHNNSYTDTKESALELMRAVASPHFQMYWQPNQFRTVEENHAYAELLAPYTKVIHVFEWSGRDRFPLAEGVPLWREYLRHFPGERTLLLEFMPDDKIETLSREAKALHEIAEVNA